MKVTLYQIKDLFEYSKSSNSFGIRLKLYMDLERLDELEVEVDKILLLDIKNARKKTKERIAVLNYLSKH